MNHKSSPRVRPQQPQKRVPQRLYRYEPVASPYTENLKHRVVYFGPRSRFNDPYDCVTSPNLCNPSARETRELREWMERYRQSAAKAGVAIEDPAGFSDEEVRRTIAVAAEDSFRQSIRDVQQSMGIACFTQSNDNLLMWSHYADKGRGVCLEFDSRAAMFSKIRAVNYSMAIPRMNPHPLLIHEEAEQAVEIMFLTKSICWKYEAEWRAFSKSQGERQYSESALTGIYFGTEINDEAMSIVFQAASQSGSRPKFWKGSRSKTNFRVEFVEIPVADTQASPP